MRISCLVTACCIFLQIMVAVPSISESVMYFSMTYLCFEFLISEKPGEVKFCLSMFSKKDEEIIKCNEAKII